MNVKDDEDNGFLCSFSFFLLFVFKCPAFTHISFLCYIFVAFSLCLFSLYDRNHGHVPGMSLLYCFPFIMFECVLGPWWILKPSLYSQIDTHAILYIPHWLLAHMLHTCPVGTHEDMWIWADDESYVTWTAAGNNKVNSCEFFFNEKNMYNA